MIEYIDAIDARILLFFNNHHSQFFDNFMIMFTGRFVWIPMYAAILLWLVKSLGAKRALIYVAGIALAITLTDQICATFIRPVVERMRPSNLDNPLSVLIQIVDDYRGGDYGFPSCHAANSFALAVFLAGLRRRRIAIFIIIWAFLNSYTRLYLGVHYPGDLLAGAIIGSGLALICFKGCRLLDKYLFPEQAGNSILPSPLLRSQIIPGGQFTAGDFIIFIGLATSIAIFALSF